MGGAQITCIQSPAVGRLRVSPTDDPSGPSDGLDQNSTAWGLRGGSDERC